MNGCRHLFFFIFACNHHKSVGSRPQAGSLIEAGIAIHSSGQQHLENLGKANDTEGLTDELGSESSPSSPGRGQGRSDIRHRGHERTGTGRSHERSTRGHRPSNLTTRSERLSQRDHGPQRNGAMIPGSSKQYMQYSLEVLSAVGVRKGPDFPRHLSYFARLGKYFECCAKSHPTYCEEERPRDSDHEHTLAAIFPLGVPDLPTLSTQDILHLASLKDFLILTGELQGSRHGARTVPMNDLADEVTLSCVESGGNSVKFVQDAAFHHNQAGAEETFTFVRAPEAGTSADESPTINADATHDLNADNFMLRSGYADEHANGVPFTNPDPYAEFFVNGEEDLSVSVQFPDGTRKSVQIAIWTEGGTKQTVASSARWCKPLDAPPNTFLVEKFTGREQTPIFERGPLRSVSGIARAGKGIHSVGTCVDSVAGGPVNCLGEQERYGKCIEEKRRRNSTMLSGLLSCSAVHEACEVFKCAAIEHNQEAMQQRSFIMIPGGYYVMLIWTPPKSALDRRIEDLGWQAPAAGRGEVEVNRDLHGEITAMNVYLSFMGAYFQQSSHVESATVQASELREQLQDESFRAESPDYAEEVTRDLEELYKNWHQSLPAVQMQFRVYQAFGFRLMTSSFNATRLSSDEMFKKLQADFQEQRAMVQNRKYTGGATEVKVMVIHENFDKVKNVVGDLTSNGKFSQALQENRYDAEGYGAASSSKFYFNEPEEGISRNQQQIATLGHNDGDGMRIEAEFPGERGSRRSVKMSTQVPISCPNCEEDTVMNTGRWYTPARYRLSTRGYSLYYWHNDKLRRVPDGMPNDAGIASGAYIFKEEDLYKYKAGGMYECKDPTSSSGALNTSTCQHLSYAQVKDVEMLSLIPLDRDTRNVKYYAALMWRPSSLVDPKSQAKAFSDQKPFKIGVRDLGGMHEIDMGEIDMLELASVFEKRYGFDSTVVTSIEARRGLALLTHHWKQEAQFVQAQLEKLQDSTLRARTGWA